MSQAEPKCTPRTSEPAPAAGRKSPAQINTEWAQRVEVVCDLVGLEPDRRPQARPEVYRFLRGLYLSRFERVEVSA